MFLAKIFSCVAFQFIARAFGLRTRSHERDSWHHEKQRADMLCFSSVGFLTFEYSGFSVYWHCLELFPSIKLQAGYMLEDVTTASTDIVLSRDVRVG